MGNSAYHSAGSTKDYASSRSTTETDLRAANLSFLTENAPPLSPIDDNLIQEISAHRRLLFQDFENRVAKPFAESLARMDAEGIVKVAGSYNNPSAIVRRSSDVDLVVLSRELKDPVKYLHALLTLSQLAREWREQTLEQTGRHVEPVFFTRAITEEDKFGLVHLATGCDELDILPCHFLYYRDEAEILLREEELGRRLLSNSRAVIERRSMTDAVFRVDPSKKLSALETIPWNVERAMAEFVLNQSLVPPKLIARSYANQIYNVVRNLADILPLPEEEKSVGRILRLLDQDRADGLMKSFKPIEALRLGAPIGERLHLVELLTPAIEILKSLGRYIETPN